MEKTHRIGELLVNERLVTQAQVDDALAIQRRGHNYRPLGRILVDSNVLSLAQLKAFAEAKKIRPQLEELLLKAKAVSPDDLCLALEHSKQHKTPLAEALLQRGMCTEEQLKQALALQLDIEYLNLDSLEISPFPASLINGSYARKQKMCPLGHTKSEITVAMHDPTNFAVQREITVSTGMKVRVVTATLPMIMKALTQAYPIPVQEKDIVVTDAPVIEELELVIEEGFEYSQGAQKPKA